METSKIPRGKGTKADLLRAIKGALGTAKKESLTGVAALLVAKSEWPEERGRLLVGLFDQGVVATGFEDEQVDAVVKRDAKRDRHQNGVDKRNELDAGADDHGNAHNLDAAGQDAGNDRASYDGADRSGGGNDIANQSDLFPPGNGGGHPGEEHP